MLLILKAIIPASFYPSIVVLLTFTLILMRFMAEGFYLILKGSQRVFRVLDGGLIGVSTTPIFCFALNNRHNLSFQVFSLTFSRDVTVSTALLLSTCTLAQNLVMMNAR